jgi:hypothetical protein
VARLRQKLGARTLFTLGARAKELGLVSEEAG